MDIVLFLQMLYEDLLNMTAVSAVLSPAVAPLIAFVTVCFSWCYIRANKWRRRRWWWHAISTMF